MRGKFYLFSYWFKDLTFLTNFIVISSSCASEVLVQLFPQISQVENSETSEITETMKKAVKQSNCIIYHWKLGSIYTNFHFIQPENKKLINTNFPWFPGFRFEPYTQKRKLRSHGNFTKTSYYCNIRM